MVCLSHKDMGLSHKDMGLLGFKLHRDLGSGISPTFI